MVIRNLNYDWQGNLVVDILHDKICKELKSSLDIKDFGLFYRSQNDAAFVYVGKRPFQEGHVIPSGDIVPGKLELRYREAIKEEVKMKFESFMPSS